jgi:hypothetical protein
VIGPAPHLDPEPIRLDGERLLEGEPVAGVIGQGEALEDHPQDQGGFLQRELPADARPLAVAEGLVGVTGTPLLGLA